MIGLRIGAGGTVTDYFDTSGIPDDSAYWRALERRVTAAVLRRESTMAWLTTSRAAWLAAASLVFATVLASSVVAIRRNRAESPGARGLEAALVPGDRLGQLLAESEAPPMLVELTAPAAPMTRGAR